jgi:hypothetical protein
LHISVTEIEREQRLDKGTGNQELQVRKIGVGRKKKRGRIRK